MPTSSTADRRSQDRLPRPPGLSEATVRTASTWTLPSITLGGPVDSVGAADASALGGASGRSCASAMPSTPRTISSSWSASASSPITLTGTPVPAG